MSRSREQFLADVRAFWTKAIADVGASQMTTVTWTGASRIGEALDHFLGENVNHAHYPTGGGFDWRSREEVQERDCLALKVENRLVDIFRPERMILEHFPDRVQESFLLIELATLEANPVTGVYRDSQEYVEVPGYDCFERSVWDAGYIGYDEDGREIPIPEDARLVERWLSGKILVVAKGSRWNSSPRTYDGRHAQMRSDEIRDAIESSIRAE